MRILVVEDEKKIAAFIKRGLKEAGYAVDTAPDGQEGHFLATTNDYDLIILDVMMPKMDGVTLCRRLRKDCVSVPIMMLTVRDKVEDKVEGLDAGANDYLTKPFVFDELLARVRALLRTNENATPTRLSVDDLTIDLVTRNASRGGKNIILTAKEFALLEYLMRYTGKLVTRTMICEHVWDINFDTDTNIIEVHINHLRRKIDQGFKKKLIHTLRGQGYILKG